MTDARYSYQHGGVEALLMECSEEPDRERRLKFFRKALATYGSYVVASFMWEISTDQAVFDAVMRAVEQKRADTEGKLTVLTWVDDRP